jgi:hypothetical protein
MIYYFIRHPAAGKGPVDLGAGDGQSITQSRTLLRGRKAADPGRKVPCGMVRC